MAIAVGKKLLAWDESIDDEVQFRTGLQEEAIKAGELKEDERKTEKEIEEDIYTDQDYWQMSWEDTMDALTDILKQKNRTGYWKARVRNFGWRSLDGTKSFQAESGSDFLREILPQTDCHFNVFNYGRGLAVQNFHHDSPVGNEWYYILPAARPKYEE